MLTFSFFWKTIVSLWKRRWKIENETIIFKNDRFFKKFVFKNGRLINDRFQKRFTILTAELQNNSSVNSFSTLKMNYPCLCKIENYPSLCKIMNYPCLCKIMNYPCLCKMMNYPCLCKMFKYPVKLIALMWMGRK